MERSAALQILAIPLGIAVLCALHLASTQCASAPSGGHEAEPRLVRQPIANEGPGIVVREIEKCIGNLVFFKREENLDGILLGFRERTGQDQLIEPRSGLLW